MADTRSTRRINITSYLINNYSLESRGIIEIAFNPQTEYWKKITKTTINKSKLTKYVNMQNSIIPSLKKEGKLTARSECPTNLQLFSNDEIQQELINVFKKFIDSSAFMLRNKSSENSKKDEIIILDNNQNTTMNIETQKYLKMTRIYVCLIIVLFSSIKSEQTDSLQSILDDLNTENVKIGEYLKIFFIDNDSVHILFWIMNLNMDDLELIQITTDIFLTLCSNGPHYKNFIRDISLDERVLVNWILN